MHHVHHAIDFIRDAAKLPTLALDQNGRADLMVEGKWPIRLQRIDDRHLELYSPLGEAGPSIGRDTLLGLLKANYLGDGVGNGRLVVSPFDGKIGLGERIDVKPLDEGALEQRVLGFMKYVAFWNSDELDELLETHATGAEETAAIADSFVVRA